MRSDPGHSATLIAQYSKERLLAEMNPMFWRNIEVVTSLTIIHNVHVLHVTPVAPGLYNLEGLGVAYLPNSCGAQA
jgi:hypothetical protein